MARQCDMCGTAGDHRSIRAVTIESYLNDPRQSRTEDRCGVLHFDMCHICFQSIPALIQRAVMQTRESVESQSGQPR